MRRMLTKRQFISEVQWTLGDVKNRKDCEDWWSGLVDAYMDDSIISQNAGKWINPFLSLFEE